MKNRTELQCTETALLALVNVVYYVQDGVKNKRLKKRLDNAMQYAELTLQSNRERRALGTAKPSNPRKS
jgi:hypothetical protein